MKELKGLPAVKISAQLTLFPGSIAKKTQNWSQRVTKQTNKKKNNRSFRKVKSRTVNSGRLNLKDPKTMDEWSYDRLYEIFC